MKINYADYIKKTDASVLVAEAIFAELALLYPLKSIEKVAVTTSGGTPLRSNYEYYGGNIPWLKSGELNDGIIEKVEEFITEKGLANSSAKLHPKNTLLLAMYGATAGRTGITTMESSTNQAVCALFPKADLNQGYLFWFLRQHRYKFIEISKGGAQPNISQSVIKATKLPVPNLELQIEISELLFTLENGGTLDLSLVPIQFRSKVDKVFGSKNNVFEINNELNHQLDLIKQLRKSFLREAMQGRLTVIQAGSKENQETGQQLLQKIKAEKEQLIKDKKLKKEKELPPIKPEEIPFEIPKDWVWCRLGELAKIITSGSRDWAKYYSKEGAIFVRMGNLSRDSFNLRMNSIQYVNPSKNSEGGRTKLEENDILISITGEVGNLGLIPANFGEAYINQHTALLRLSTKVKPKYICYNLLSDFLKCQFDAPQRGLKNSFRLTDVDNLMIPLPPYHVQQILEEKLSALMQTCDHLEFSIQQSQQQNEQLLQQVLREALEVKAVDEKGKDVKIVKLPALTPEEDFYYQKRKALATYILNQSLSDPWLGDTKLMKLLHLADYHAIKRNLGQKFYQKAAGPFDNGFIYPFFEEIERDRWFKRVKQDGRFYFSPGTNHNQSLQMNPHFSEEELNAVDQIIAYFRKDNYERPEIVSTLYAVWNNRIINGLQVSDELLKQDFLDWDAQKIKYQFRLSNELQWMKDKGIVPDGWGRLIEKPRNNRDGV